MEAQFPGMDYDFLRYMGVFPENQRRIQSHYLPYFAQCKRVVDLACGDADFVDLLVEQGIDVVGVDSDDKAFAASAAKGRPVVQQDVFDWLAAQADASVDGVFSAHLIEHLPYPKVVELIEQSYRILQPGGVILLATPNARSIFSHLEMFYTHFGHITFYHPRLVSFFLDRAGFKDAQFGENPQTASPLLAQARALLDEQSESNSLPEEPEFEWPIVADLQREATALTIPQSHTRSALNYPNEIPPQGTGWHRTLSWRLKRAITNWLVRPLIDGLALQVEKEIAAETSRITSLMKGLSWEIAERLEQQREQTFELRDEISHLRSALKRLDEARRGQHSALQEETRLLRRDIQTIVQSVQSLNGAFETFIWARKPQAEQPVEASGAAQTQEAAEPGQRQEPTNDQTTTERE